MNMKRKPGLTRRQVEVLAIIYALSKQRGYCSVSKIDMARWLDISKTDIYGDIKYLEEQGLIFKKPEYQGRIYLTKYPLKEFCMNMDKCRIEDAEEHLYLNIPYWMFSLTDMEDKEFLSFIDEINMHCYKRIDSNGCIRKAYENEYDDDDKYNNSSYDWLDDLLEAKRQEERQKNLEGHQDHPEKES